jgi:cytochrome c peroxidase
LSEYLAAAQPPAITEALWKDLLQRFAPVSESYLRELLRSTGLPFEQPYAGIRQHTFEELEQSLRDMLHVYAEATAAGDRQRARYCRRQVIAAKDRARFQARAPREKARKEEMAQWMLVWLENPEVFPAWVEARKPLLPRDRQGAVGPLLLCLLLSLVGQAVPPARAASPPAPPLGLPPVVWPADNPYSAARVELGRNLFFDPRLSSTGKVSCATCHPPERAFAGGDPPPRGVTGTPLRRRAPTLINRAYGRSQFVDGRAATLEAQISGPISAPDEMGTSPSAATGAVSSIAGYAPLFEEAFGDRQVTYDRIVKAIASFERTIVSGNSPYDRFLNGDKHALTPGARRGLDIFQRSGECSECHSGYNFTDEKFSSLGIGPDQLPPDLGLGAITGKRRDDGKFKVPTLREVVHTGPYMHDGRDRTLDEVLEFYRKGGQPSRYLDSRIAPFFLDAPAKANLVEFLESLSGEGWQQIKAPEKLPQ